ncbi:MAG: SAM-dependent methyltransferase [Deltaproteobacteria bacterium]|jgi:precorrin-4 methylase|nr:SAM-dependent methyltransferase [Deltaproteobacteria bacterium]
MATLKRYHATALTILFVFLCVGLSICYAGEKGKLYVVGMGPAGPDLTAPRALAIVEKADVFLCSPGMPKRFESFGKHINPDKVAFNPWEGILGKEAEKLKKTDYQAWVGRVDKQIKKVQEFVLECIKDGKTVVMMDGGDPCVYGPSLHWLLRGLDDSYFEVIPGMGAFNAAGAALKRTMTPDDVRFIMLTSPDSLFGKSHEKDEILKDLSKYKVTMVFYMSLSSMNELVEKFKRYYPPDFPLAVVFYAGYSDRETVLRSNLGNILDDLKKVDEKWVGLLIIGECVK